MNDYARTRMRDRNRYPSQNYAHFNRDNDDYDDDLYYERRHEYEDRRRSYRDGRYRDYNVDYAMSERRLSRSDIEQWKRELKNEDGTTGGHFSRDEVEQAARNAGINIERFGASDFCMAMNMIYSDYCATAKKYGVNKPEFFAELAKDFLEDKDFGGDGAEKLMLYYKCIVEYDE